MIYEIEVCMVQGESEVNTKERQLYKCYTAVSTTRRRLAHTPQVLGGVLYEWSIENDCGTPQ